MHYIVIMTRFDELNELNALGESEELEEQEEDYSYEDPQKEDKDRNYIPMIQLFLCAAALIAMLVLKYTDSSQYQEIVNWYQKEISAEIELPEFAGKGEEASSSPSVPAESEQSTVPDNDNTAVHVI